MGRWYGWFGMDIGTVITSTCGNIKLFSSCYFHHWSHTVWIFHWETSSSHGNSSIQASRKVHGEVSHYLSIIPALAPSDTRSGVLYQVLSLHPACLWHSSSVIHTWGQHQTHRGAEGTATGTHRHSRVDTWCIPTGRKKTHADCLFSFDCKMQQDI